MPSTNAPAAQGLSGMAMNFAAAGGAALSGVILDHLGFGALAAIAAAMLPLPALPAVRGQCLPFLGGPRLLANRAPSACVLRPRAVPGGPGRPTWRARPFRLSAR
ncbi:hypothetical protein G3I19_01915 [Streptomyces sp. SID10853]|uniref:hypothetical protein n=1 Tax=Streptomyces sp. SID10853 TaxID=2706028 RepID=UPI0013C0AAFB|nr:hypothetical protein [Streptomyces sp. SID10853]NDZ77298.1 hypothetical protein [Streptomyces sp. SID10853]